MRIRPIGGWHLLPRFLRWVHCLFRFHRSCNLTVTVIHHDTDRVDLHDALWCECGRKFYGDVEELKERL